MLQYLRIRNLAVVEAAELEFGPGFTAITGETGAGKSVLLGALALLAGERADKGRIRHGSDALEVEAALHLAHPARVDALLDELGLPRCDDGQLLIQRTVAQARAPRISVNGRLTTQANLAALGPLWLDIHGPGEPQTLFKERRQLELLDLHSRNQDLLAAYRERFHAWRELLQKAHALRTAERLSPDEADFIRNQLDLIGRIDLSEDAVAALDRDFMRLESAQELIEGSGAIATLLNGDDGACDKLGDAAMQARQLVRMDPALQPLADRIESALIELADLAEEFEATARDADFDEEAAQSIRERMEAWLQVKRKYGPDVRSVLAKRTALQQRLDSQTDVEGQLLRLEKEAAKLEATLATQAATLRESRLRGALDLGKQATALLARLGFKHAVLRIDITREPALREHGDSSCVFLFAPNAGHEPQPLNKIASSGEIARVMLALKTVLAAADETPVLVFDEVDANVGGEVAVEVGRELAGLGARHQVFSVTHLPQVAAQAPAHFVVEKIQLQDRTDVSIRRIDTAREARVEELARMLGNRHSDAARSHAETLLGNGS